MDARAIVSPNVYVGMSMAPRHLFVPDVELQDAYADDVVITKVDADGRALSSASAPWLVATMLEYAQIAPGDNCLEIGTGTGYNAWIMHHIAGYAGSVTSIEIDAEVAAQAVENLESAGCRDVEVIVGDGARGYLSGAPYDAIIVTAGSWDIAPAWFDQLRNGGRLVVPLRWRGQTRCVAFRRVDDSLVSEDMTLCGFIPMRNDDGEIQIALDDTGRVLTYDSDQDIDAVAIKSAYRDQVAADVWSGCFLKPQESLDTLWLTVIMAEHGACLSMAPADVHRVVVAEADSMAMLEVGRDGAATSGVWELGASGYGPQGAKLAQRLVGHVQAWNRDRSWVPRLQAFPAGSEATRPAGRVIEKVFTRLIMIDDEPDVDH